ncbi:MAG TPA: glycosyltransferase [Myxococcaceae bacterium]|nr:glycosyltransferase [Myxococcaceae bacterium]
MHLALVTVGSLGDVAPIFALGLKRAGHTVRILAHESFSPMASRLGLDLAPTRAADPRALLASERFRDAFRAADPFRAWRRFGAIAEETARAVFADALAACEGADAVGCSGLGAFPGYAAAARLGIPHFGAHLIPIGPTSEFPDPLLPQGLAWLPGYNWTSHALAAWLVWRSIRPMADRAMASTGAGRFPPLARMASSSRILLFGISPAVVSPPAGWRRARFTGYWFLDDPTGWKPPPQLQRFLDQGSPPVVVGFGSMSTRNPVRTARIVVEALVETGARGILLSGWGGLRPEELPSQILAMEHAPHAWLFPRAAAVVHHGGAGTTASALRAGVPSVVVPFAFDQPFWAERVRRLGAGPAPIPERRLSVGRLARAIRRALEDYRLGQTARALGECIRSEDGVGTAVRELEHVLDPAVGSGPRIGLAALGPETPSQRPQ